MVTKKDILAKLSEVMDPELGVSIVDLGLVYEVKIKKQNAQIKITFTTPACPLINDMLNQIKTKLEEFEDMDIEINIVFDPPWNPDMMNEKTKIKLGII
ncbi:MAG: metal-sulfur cluster assembly factor [Candidatus Micrarchaeota archaeon]